MTTAEVMAHRIADRIGPWIEHHGWYFDEMKSDEGCTIDNGGGMVGHDDPGATFALWIKGDVLWCFTNPDHPEEGEDWGAALLKGRGGDPKPSDPTGVLPRRVGGVPF